MKHFELRKETALYKNKCIIILLSLQVRCDAAVLGRGRQNQAAIRGPHSHHQGNHSPHRVRLWAEGWPGRHLHQYHPAQHAGLPLPWHADERIKEHACVMSKTLW